MPVDYHVARARAIRKLILSQLWCLWKGSADTCLPVEQIYEAIAGQRTTYTREEVDAQLMELLDARMIEDVKIDYAGPLPGKHYRITSRGRDFKMAEFPWDRIDEFTGSQRLE